MYFVVGFSLPGAASMRPGRNAPDNAADDRVVESPLDASMRPGRNAPDNAAAGVRHAAVRTGFNEAGAKCPG